MAHSLLGFAGFYLFTKIQQDKAKTEELNAEEWEEVGWNLGMGLRNLAVLYANQGRYGEAEPLLQRALAIDEKALGPDHPLTAIDVRNYALFLRSRGRAAEAEKLVARFKLPRH